MHQSILLYLSTKSRGRKEKKSRKKSVSNYYFNEFRIYVNKFHLLIPAGKGTHYSKIKLKLF